MVEKQDNVYYYITLLNENYAMPGLTAGTQEQIIKGMYRARGQSGRGDCQVRHSDRQGQPTARRKIGEANRALLQVGPESQKS